MHLRAPYAFFTKLAVFKIGYCKQIQKTYRSKQPDLIVYHRELIFVGAFEIVLKYTIPDRCSEIIRNSEEAAEITKAASFLSL